MRPHALSSRKPLPSSHANLDSNPSRVEALIGSSFSLFVRLVTDVAYKALANGKFRSPTTNKPKVPVPTTVASSACYYYIILESLVPPCWQSPVFVLGRQTQPKEIADGPNVDAYVCNNYCTWHGVVQF
jgi:hypothetical protein